MSSLDDSNYHQFKASGQPFEVYKKYSLIRPIGHGAYGIVISALDSETNEKVAIKKITKAFSDPVDAKRILREIILMKKLKTHENIISIIDIMPPPSGTPDFEDIYIIQDLMETDLHRIIYSRQQLSIDHIQYFIYQLLRGLKYIHSANILHRDLKPSNILLNSNCDLKICDFGLARSLESEQTGELTEYVVTRWYRAPEIMLACQDYTKAIDVWSAGCIFAELLARSPMFPGEDYIAQLRLICDKLGRPTEENLDFVSSERAKKFMMSLPATTMKPVAQLFPNHTENFHAVDLVLEMLEFHPGHRLSTEKALEHPFLQTLHNVEDEPDANFTFTFDFEDEDLDRERIQELMWREMRTYHPEINDTFPTTLARRKKSKQAQDEGSFRVDVGDESNTRACATVLK